MNDPKVWLSLAALLLNIFFWAVQRPVSLFRRSDERLCRDVGTLQTHVARARRLRLLGG